jgi:hypothetical protein
VLARSSQACNLELQVCTGMVDLKSKPRIPEGLLFRKGKSLNSDVGLDAGRPLCDRSMSFTFRVKGEYGRRI